MNGNRQEQRGPASTAAHNAAGATQGEQTQSPREDAELRAYLRAPYDPLRSARMTGQATGDVVRRPPAHGWLGAMAILLVVALLSLPIIGILKILITRPRDEGVQILLISSPFGYAGLYLLSRLVRQNRARGS